MSRTAEPLHISHPAPSLAPSNSAGMDSDSAFDPTDSASFRSQFNAFRQQVLSLVSTPLRCDSPAAPKWEDGVIMQQGQSEDETAAKTEKDLKREAADCKRCERWRDELTRESESRPCTVELCVRATDPHNERRSATGPIIRFMLQHISLLPPSSPASSSPGSQEEAPSPTPHLPLPIVCKPCPPTMAGGYSSELGVLLCQNRFMGKPHMQDALAHELVHAYDDRRFKPRGGKTWAEDLRAHACTEVSHGRVLSSILTADDKACTDPSRESQRRLQVGSRVFEAKLFLYKATSGTLLFASVFSIVSSPRR